MKFPILFLLGYYSVLLCSPVTHASRNLDSLVEGIRGKNNAVGLAAWSVAGNGTMCAIGSAGESIRWTGQKLQANGDSRQGIGSVTKSMTSTLLAILIEGGSRITSWENTLGELLVSAQGTAYEKVKLRELVGHLAGLPRDPPRWQDPFWYSWQTDDAREARKLATEKILQVQPINTPGTEFSYSNRGIVVAGHIVEDVTGMSWEDAVTTLLFEPLGIQLEPGTFTFAPRNNNNDDDDDTADYWGHIPLIKIPCNPSIYPCYLPITAGPSGSFSGPIAAMARYLSFHLACHRGEHDNLLLSQEACRTLHSPAASSIDAEYGYGWSCYQADWAGDANGNDAYACSHSGSNGFNMYYATLAFGINRAFVSFTNQGPAPCSSDFDNLLLGPVNSMIAEQNQEDCAEPIPSSVYIV